MNPERRQYIRKHKNKKSNTWRSKQVLTLMVKGDLRQRVMYSSQIRWGLSSSYQLLCFLFQFDKINKEESESEATQFCLTLCDPMDCSLPGSSIHGIFQARILEWVVISFSRRSPQPRDWTWVSCIVGRCFTIWAKQSLEKWTNPGVVIMDTPVKLVKSTVILTYVSYVKYVEVCTLLTLIWH